MAHIGFGADAGADGAIVVPAGVTVDVLNWEPLSVHDDRAYDEQARVTCSHSRNGTAASLGCQFNIYRVLGAEELLVFAIPLADNIAERLVAGPFDKIRVRAVQLGGAGAAGDSVSATAVARIEND